MQIAESVAGRRRIVRHVGSARDEAELGLLMEEARCLLEDDRQGVLDLGITPQARRAAMVPAPGQPALFGGEPAPGPRLVVPRARTLKTASGLLYDVLAGVYADLGFDALGDEVFRDLVIARVVEPTSLLDADRVLAEMGRVSASLSTRKRTLRRCFDGNYRDRLAELCFTHVLACGDISLVLYDVTTLYFEAEHEDGLRKAGYSKERRVDPQIVAGLLADRQGFPLEIGCFEGNKAEKHTILPIVSQFRARHGIENFAVVADAGMLSAANLAALDTAGCKFIVGSRLTRAPIDLESHFRWHGDYFGDGQVIDTLTPKTGRNGDNDPALLAEPVLGPPGAPRVVAGGAGILPQPRRPGHQDPDRSGEPRPRRHHRRQGRPHAPVRQDRQERVRPRRGRARPRPAPGRPQRLRHQHSGNRDARHRGDHQLSRPVARRDGLYATGKKGGVAPRAKSAARSGSRPGHR